MLTIENAVAGKRYVSSSPRRSPVFNPATGEQTAELPLSTLDEINAAVASAKKATESVAVTVSASALV